MNEFIYIIYNKVPLSFKTVFKYLRNKSQYKKFKKKIYNCSPDFDLLWEMADFIKIAENVFCYDNSLPTLEKGYTHDRIGLYSSRSYNSNENGFKIINSKYCNNCNITVKLYAKNRRISIEIDRYVGHGIVTTMHFRGGEWECDHFKYDEILVDNVIDIINTCILKLFDECYKAKNRRRYFEDIK